MRILDSNSKVLLTGTNGYIGSWALQSLLTKGYTVRATVRALSKAKPLEAFFDCYVKEGKLEFVEVPDVMKVCVGFYFPSSRRLSANETLDW